MPSYFESLLSGAHAPPGSDSAWNSPLPWLHIGSDALISAACLSLSLTFLILLIRRPPGGKRSLLALSAGFVLAGAGLHLDSIIGWWAPNDGALGLAKAATAALAVLTAIGLWKVLPRLLTLPSATALQVAVEQLRAEVQVRRGAEAELRALKAGLEDSVRTRTAELEQAKDALLHEVGERKRIDQLKDELLAMASHELRTPLTSVAGSLQMLSAPDSLVEAERRELMEIAQRNTERMMRLVKNMLDIDRIESGRLAFTAAPLSISALMQAAVRENQPYAHQHGVRLVFSDHSQGAIVRGDADWLMQVVTNLLSNAVKHSPADAPVELSAQVEDGQVRVRVTDRGPGVPVDYRDSVFDRFVQVPRGAAYASEGVGLGLSISRSIVSRHGGRMGLESEPGLRTTFHFSLPLAEGATDEGTERAAEGDRAEAAQRTPPA